MVTILSAFFAAKFSQIAPVKIRRRLESVHSEHLKKSVELFIRKLDELLKSII